MKVRTAATAEVDVPPLDGEIIAERVGPDGAVAEYGVPFDRVVVRNPNSAAVRVRVVLVQFDSPPSGEHQQFVRARPIGGVVRLEPRSRRTLELDRPAVGSVKAYITR